MSFLGSRNSIIIFTVVAALIHLALGISNFGDNLGKAFVANGIGYLVLMYALLWTPSFLRGQESLVRWAFLAFTAVTFVLYFVFNGAGSFSSIPGLITKLDELLLMISIWQYKG